MHCVSIDDFVNVNKINANTIKFVSRKYLIDKSMLCKIFYFSLGKNNM